MDVEGYVKIAGFQKFEVVEVDEGHVNGGGIVSFPEDGNGEDGVKPGDGGRRIRDGNGKDVGGLDIWRHIDEFQETAVFFQFLTLFFGNVVRVFRKGRI